MTPRQAWLDMEWKRVRRPIHTATLNPHLNPAGHASALHARGGVHRVPKDGELGHLCPNQSSHTRTGVDPNANLNIENGSNPDVPYYIITSM